MGKLQNDSSFFLSKAFSLKKKNNSILQKTPTEYFKQEFIDGFNDFKSDVDALSRGYLSLSSGWKDIAGYVAVSVAFTGGGAVIGALSGFAILSAGATAGIGTAIALIGIGAEVSYIIYRSKKKEKEYKRASKFLDDRDFNNDVAKIADLLASLYQEQLSKCSHAHAKRLAQAISKGLRYEMMKNKHLRYSHLFNRASLQAIILSAKNHISKDDVTLLSKNALKTKKNSKSNTRGIVSKAALYCRDEDKIYTCDKSRPAKYGILYFETSQELEDYTKYVDRLKDKNKHWQYDEMISTEESELRRALSFFPAVSNDNRLNNRDGLSVCNGADLSDETRSEVDLRIA